MDITGDELRCLSNDQLRAQESHIMEQLGKLLTIEPIPVPETLTLITKIETVRAEIKRRPVYDGGASADRNEKTEE